MKLNIQATTATTLTKYRMVKSEELCALLGISRQTLTRLVAKGLFPPPVRIGTRGISWPEVEVLAWINRDREAPQSALDHDEEHCDEL